MYTLLLLFEQSLDEGVFLSFLKLSLNTPIPKSSNPLIIPNYRPISILFYISKLFESLVLTGIQPVVNNIFLEEYHVFRPGCSTTIRNPVFSYYVFKYFNQNLQVDVIYTDIAKAFDKVNY